MTESERGDGPASDRQASEPGEPGEDPEAFVDLAGHFYRGEVERMVSWRTRLDQTTNWAVVLMAAILTFTFASPDNPHYVLLLGALGVGAFLIVESQRYQEYDAWRYRVRLLQRNLMADVFGSDDPPADDWQRRLGDDLRKPELSYSRWRALAHRLKRVYFLLLSVLLVAWLLRISVFEAGESWQETASIADLPGALVVGLVVALFTVLAAVTLWGLLRIEKREFSDPSLEDE